MEYPLQPGINSVRCASDRLQATESGTQRYNSQLDPEMGCRLNVLEKYAFTNFKLFYLPSCILAYKGQTVKVSYKTSIPWIFTVISEKSVCNTLV